MSIATVSGAGVSAAVPLSLALTGTSMMMPLVLIGVALVGVGAALLFRNRFVDPVRPIPSTHWAAPPGNRALRRVRGRAPVTTRASTSARSVRLVHRLRPLATGLCRSIDAWFIAFVGPFRSHARHGPPRAGPPTRPRAGPPTLPRAGPPTGPRAGPPIRPRAGPRQSYDPRPDG